MRAPLRLEMVPQGLKLTIAKCQMRVKIGVCNSVSRQLVGQKITKYNNAMLVRTTASFKEIRF